MIEVELSDDPHPCYPDSTGIEVTAQAAEQIGSYTARLALAAELPAAVLASLTGIEVTTADAWNKPQRASAGLGWGPASTSW